MSQKGEKPTLSGQRIKTRKRDEKEKYDPNTFRDTIIIGLTEAGSDLDQVSKYLDLAGSKLNYRRYADAFFDVLFAGGILAPGGFVIDDSSVPRSKICVFTANKTHEGLREYYEVMFKLIRRYKYLEKSFTEELQKLLLFLKGFSSEEREKLGTILGICLSNGLGESTCLPVLLEEHLVKDGLSIELTTFLFRAWLKEKDMNSLANGLKKAGMHTKLLKLFPVHKRTMAHFEEHFNEAGIPELIVYQKDKMASILRQNCTRNVNEMMEHDETVKDIVIYVKSQSDTLSIPDHEMVILIWNCLVNGVEWNKKEELVAEQALRHLLEYSELLQILCTSGKSQIALIQKVQEYCYDNMMLLKVFQKIIQLFYKKDVLDEDNILKWYKEAHLTKGKTIFLEQMKSFVEWLQTAEEESDDE